KGRPHRPSGARQGSWQSGIDLPSVPSLREKGPQFTTLTLLKSIFRPDRSLPFGIPHGKLPRRTSFTSSLHPALRFGCSWCGRGGLRGGFCQGDRQHHFMRPRAVVPEVAREDVVRIAEL